MRYILSLFLSLILIVSPVLALACTPSPVASPELNSPSISPSITADALQDLFGAASIFKTSQFEAAIAIQNFSDNVIDYIPLMFYPDADSKVKFTLYYPEFDNNCFIIDVNGNVLGNVKYEHEICVCGDSMYNFVIEVAPDKNPLNEVVYLVWVE